MDDHDKIIISIGHFTAHFAGTIKGFLGSRSRGAIKGVLVLLDPIDHSRNLILAPRVGGPKSAGVA
ncbi:MAG: hypothetical protein M1457_07935 [bacterium]|nr:hypothetical protein [bacterium]